MDKDAKMKVHIETAAEKADSAWATQLIRKMPKTREPSSMMKRKTIISAVASIMLYMHQYRLKHSNCKTVQRKLNSTEYHVGVLLRTKMWGKSNTGKRKAKLPTMSPKQSKYCPDHKREIKIGIKNKIARSIKYNNK